MNTLQEVKEAVSRFSPEEFAAFRDWIANLDAGRWDCQMEKDVQAGRLDQLAEKALQHPRDGRCTEL